MSAPQWSPADDETYDLLSVVADPHPIVGVDATDTFLAACRRDAMANAGLVSVNRVAALLADADIPPRVPRSQVRPAPQVDRGPVVKRPHLLCPATPIHLPDRRVCLGCGWERRSR